MALPAPPLQGLSQMSSANLQQAPIQAAARAPGVATQQQPAKSPLDQAVPPQMQGLQAQLGQIAQQGQQAQPGMMQAIMQMLGPGAGAMMPPALGQLMQPMAPAPAAPAAPAPSSAPMASPIASPAQLR